MASLSGWIEGIVVFMIAVSAIGIIVGAMNIDYGKTNEVPFETSATQQALESWKANIANQTQGGEVQFTSSYGLQLTTLWGVVSDAFTLVWDFITGSAIDKACYYMGLGFIAIYIKMLYFLSIGLIIIYLFFKVKP